MHPDTDTAASEIKPIIKQLNTERGDTGSAHIYYVITKDE